MVSCNLLKFNKQYVFVNYDSEECSQFYIIPIKFKNPENGDKVSADFIFDWEKDRMAVVTCSFLIDSEEENFLVLNTKVITGGFTYYSSSFDNIPVKNDKGEIIAHRVSFFIPEFEFKLMVEKNSMDIMINDVTYEPIERKWTSITREIKEKKLLERTNTPGKHNEDE